MPRLPSTPRHSAGVVSRAPKATESRTKSMPSTKSAGARIGGNKRNTPVPKATGSDGAKQFIALGAAEDATLAARAGGRK